MSDFGCRDSGNRNLCLFTQDSSQSPTTMLWQWSEESRQFCICQNLSLCTKIVRKPMNSSLSKYFYMHI